MRCLKFEMAMRRCTCWAKSLLHPMSPVLLFYSQQPKKYKSYKMISLLVIKLTRKWCLSNGGEMIIEQQKKP